MERMVTGRNPTYFLPQVNNFQSSPLSFFYSVDEELIGTLSYIIFNWASIVDIYVISTNFAELLQIGARILLLGEVIIVILVTNMLSIQGKIIQIWEMMEFITYFI